MLLDQSRKEVILRIPQPRTRRQAQEFLDATGFCRIWILGYSQMAPPLYALLTGPEGDSLNWTERQQQAFEELKLAIMSAFVLGLPDLAKPFTLYVTEKDMVAMGVLTQTMGTWDRPVAYFLKRLDNVATGWPGCLWTVAAVPLPIQEATELTLGQDLIIKVPHVVNTLPLRGPHKWLSTSQITQYQRLLRENPCVTIEPCQALNPVTFLPVGEGGPSRLQGYPRSFCQQTWLERPANLRPRLDPEHRWH